MPWNRYVCKLGFNIKNISEETIMVTLTKCCIYTYPHKCIHFYTASDYSSIFKKLSWLQVRDRKWEHLFFVTPVSLFILVVEASRRVA